MEFLGFDKVGDRVIASCRSPYEIIERAIMKAALEKVIAVLLMRFRTWMR